MAEVSAFRNPLIRSYGHLLPEGEDFISYGEMVETATSGKAAKLPE